SKRPSRDGLARAVEQMAQWEKSSDRPGERELVKLLTDLFKSSGYITVDQGDMAQPHLPESAADLAVWIDDLVGAGASPLVIEVKSHVRSEPEAVLQLQAIMTQAQSFLGLIVVWDESRPLKMHPGWPLVVQASIREVVDLVGSGRFSTELLKLRNKAVHFGS